ncbi:MAG: hypothetical protein EZS28_052847, partial [Streblomastix strix]
MIERKSVADQTEKQEKEKEKEKKRNKEKKQLKLEQQSQQQHLILDPETNKELSSVRSKANQQNFNTIYHMQHLVCLIDCLPEIFV